MADAMNLDISEMIKKQTAKTFKEADKASTIKEEPKQKNQIATYVDAEELQMIDEICAREDRSRSYYLKSLILKDIEERFNK